MVTNTVASKTGTFHSIFFNNSMRSTIPLKSFYTQLLSVIVRLFSNDEIPHYIARFHLSYCKWKVKIIIIKPSNYEYPQNKYNMNIHKIVNF